LVVLAVALVLATSFSGQRGLAIATYLLQVVYLAFTTVVSTVVYQALRTAKEGPALETLAEVFA
jgi:Mg2+/Co2+ transporter CorB